MSAIAGVYLLDGSAVDPRDLKKMNDSLSHRGPDGSGLWHEGPVGLAHQMLWTTPESLHERLPLEADGLAITSDSRIDNREELLPALGFSDDVSDSEVILKAYGQWGNRCMDKLLGDFAFAVWDKAKQELFCARDHMGLKPFYYYYHPGRVFAFATEIKALFAWGMPKRINEVAIGDYLLAMAEDKEITFYQDIFRLASANLIRVGKDGLRIEQYWKLDPMHEIRLGSDEEYEKAFRDIFREAVRCRLRSAFPVGSMLSGGLDSSSVVCMAREILPKDRMLKTFSAIFDTVKECDERQWINAVMDRGRLEAHYFYGDKIGPLTDMKRMQWYEDQPFIAPNLFLFWGLYKEAKSQNVRILLDGLDGDNVVSHGRSYITELTGKGRLLSAKREVKGLAKNQGLSPSRILLQYSLYPFLPVFLIRIMRFFRNADLGMINSEFARRINLKDRKNTLLTEQSELAKTSKEDHLRKITGGIHQAVNEIDNIVAAAFFIEPRSPFFDKRLVEFCLALPGDQKIRRGWTRWIMRSALRDILPEIIRTRRGKSNMSPNFFHGLTTFDRTDLEHAILTEGNMLSKFINNLPSSHKGSFSLEELIEKDPVFLWRAANLSLWLGALDPQILYLKDETL